jgi:outer membrane receptor protein involved in Fe transport
VKKEALFVSGQAPLLQSNNANLATTFNQQELENLPDPGNDITVFAFTAPGVTMSTTGYFGNFSAFGLPSISNLFTLNGMDHMIAYQNLNVSGATSLTLGANEIQEAAVVLNGYTGQYGRMAGANVNYITKSGANAFHGNALWDYNGQALNANYWFNNATGTPRPFEISNAWADSLGGPILKNKVFFFFDNEGLRYVVPSGGPVYIPTPDFASLVLTKLAATNPAAVPLYTRVFNLYAGASGAARARPVTAAVQHLGCGDFADPISGYGLSKPCAATFQNTVNALNTEWLAATKVDYDITSNDRIYLRLSMDHGLQASHTDPINQAFDANTSQPLYRGQFGYTKVISSNSVNSLLLSAGYYSFVGGPPDLSVALRTFPTTFAFSNAPYTNLGGVDNSYPAGTKGRQWQLVDDYSFLHGHHTFKAGLNVRKNFVSSYFYGAQTSGLLTFSSMTDFVNASLTKGSSYTQAFSTIGAEDLTFSSAGFYGQDEWRVRPNLTVTLALRLDRNSQIRCNGCFTELANQGSFDEIAHSASIPYNQTIRTGLSQVFHSVDPITAEPRLGVAYNVTRSTILRGGIGLFADMNPGLQADRFLTNAPAVSLFTTRSGLVATNAPNSVFAIVAASAAALQQGFANGATLAQLKAQVPPPGFTPPNFFTMSQDAHTPKYFEWNAEVQHTFADKYLLSVNYVGNHGFDELVQQLFGNAFSNAGLAGLPTKAPDPRFAEIVALNTRGWSNYNGLVTSFRWRMNAQFSGQFSYNWSHALDTCSNDCLTELFSSSGERFQLSPSLRSNYSNADYDVRHSLSAHYVYTVPAVHPHNPILKAALGKWTAAGTIFFHSGYPFSIVNSGVLNSQFGNLNGKVNQPILADFLGGSSYPSCTAPNMACYSASQFATAAAQYDFGNIPRNSFRGPGYFDTDLNVNKTIAFAEKYRLLIGASFFNILNHPNFGPPVNNVSAGAFGQILTMAPEPTGPYGAGSVSCRVIQTRVKFSF